MSKSKSKSKSKLSFKFKSPRIPRTPELRTERLIMMPLTLADAPFYQQSMGDWGMVRYITANMPWPYPATEGLRYVRKDALPAMARGKEWHWTLRLHENPQQMIGMVSLMNLRDDNRSFWMAKPWQGRGLTREACEAANRFWFETLGKTTLRVAKAADNEASRRVSIGEGMQVVMRRPQAFVCGTREEEIWELTRAQWLARQEVA